MASQCQFCAALSISRLIGLVNEEFRGRVRHHKSLADLKASANIGCALCVLILESFKSKAGDSVFSIVQNDPKSYIGVYIDASHKLKNVPVFDTLAIHVAIRDPWHFWINPLHLMLTMPREEKVVVRNYQIGRFQLDPDLGSQSNHDMARTWLRNCERNHLNCLRHGASKLPTRVIDVGPDRNSQTLRIIHSRGRAARYVTLSHCWGDDVSHVLTTKTLDRFQEGLLLYDLPANFRDAIIITRELGIRYLWIDSLCILQDSKRDWENESKKMGQFYSNSTLTISALISESARGILRREAKAPRPKSAQLNVSSGSKESRQVTVEMISDDEETLRSLDRDSPLNSRGWVLQESLLSPRQLFYGDRQIYWKCPRGYESGDGLPAKGRTPDRRYRVISSQVLYRDRLKKPPKDPVETEELLHEYYDIVKTYSSRNLTYDSDKLPAFAGLAQRIHTMLPGQYLAGLWSYDFHRGLCWYLTTPKIRLPTYRAPSWSWASTDEQVMYFWLRKFKSDRFLLQLLEYDVCLRDSSNPYGEIRAGCAIVQGYTRPLVTHKRVYDCRSTHVIHGSAVFDELGGSWTEKAFSGAAENDDSLLWFDDGLEPDAYVSRDYLVLLIGRYYTPPYLEEESEEDDDDDEDSEEEDYDWTDDESKEVEEITYDNKNREDSEGGENDESGEDSKFHGLLLSRVTNREGGEYERVGYATFNTSVSLAWVREWDRKILKLV